MNLQIFMAEDFMLNDSFVRYCLQSNEEDVAFWNDWIARNPHKRAETDKAREWVLRLGVKLNAEEKQEEFNKLRALIETDNASATRRRNYWPYAAAAMVAGCIAFAWVWKKQSPAGIPAMAYTTYRADSVRKQVLLADGSTVILNRNSVLRVPDNFNQQERHLILTGEALYDVQKDDQRPFTVTAGNTSIQVLGTVFKVRAYAFDSSVQVSLLSGKVKVAAANASKELSPGQTTKTTHDQLIAGTFDAAREQDWRNGRLSFRDASLSEVANQLEYWYGIKVHITPGHYPAIHFNGEFVNKSLPDVLASISYITNLKTDIHKGELFINH
ncbi:FecR family protein [Chitinophaga sp.]|uniref:FecR family protein n=1 Tax=Chitinophaga sp. TaxID=1869181 RepID=UPI002F91DE1A